MLFILKVIFPVNLLISRIKVATFTIKEQKKESVPGSNDATTATVTEKVPVLEGPITPNVPEINAGLRWNWFENPYHGSFAPNDRRRMSKWTTNAWFAEDAKNVVESHVCYVQQVQEPQPTAQPPT